MTQYKAKENRKVYFYILLSYLFGFTRSFCTSYGKYQMILIYLLLSRASENDLGVSIKKLDPNYKDPICDASRYRN